MTEQLWKNYEHSRLILMPDHPVVHPNLPWHAPGRCSLCRGIHGRHSECALKVFPDLGLLGLDIVSWQSEMV